MRIFLSLFIYNFILYSALFLAVLSSPFIAYKIYRTGKYRESLFHRLGIIIDPPGAIDKDDKIIWLHAVSVGETLATIELQKKIKTAFPDYKLLFTVSTETGFTIARQKCKNADAVSYFPMDFHFSLNRFMSGLNIKAVILTETEVWPNLLNKLKKMNIPVFIINGRISDHSYKNYLRYSFIFKPVFSMITGCMMQTKLDAERIIEAGASPQSVMVTGNIKYDEITAYINIDRRAVYEHFGYGQKDIIFVAGSVHPDEDRAVIDAYVEVKRKYPFLKMIIAPRKFDKISGLFEYLDSRGTAYERRSLLTAGGAYPSGDIMVLDTVGELVKVYSMARVVFVGGSLVNTGGHNLLEAAVFKKPVLFGPHTHNFKEMSSDFLKSGAGFLIGTKEELIEKIEYLLSLDDTAYDIISEKAYNEVVKRTGASGKIILYLQSSLNFVIIMLNFLVFV